MHNLMSKTALLVALTWAWPVTAQEIKSSIVGLWKLTSDVNKVVATGEILFPVGEHPSGYLLFTRGGHMMQLYIGENRKAAAGPAPTDAERVALFNSLVARSGTYKVEGMNIIIHYDGSESESVTGTNRTYAAEIIGDKMTLTASPFVRPKTGQQVISIVKFDRVE
jgi:Lipocalin-like domain